MAKMKIIGDPIADMLEDMDRVGKDIKPAVNEMLDKTQRLIQAKLKSAAAPYVTKGLKGYAQGDMYKSIIADPRVNWETATIAEVNSGFNLNEEGGYHSIFIMYGTPRIAKNTKIYNAIKGANTRREIEKLQADIINEYLKL